MSPGKPQSTSGPALIIFQCPGCGAKLRAKAEYVRRQFRCPTCRATVTVPGEPEHLGGGSNALSVSDTASARSASSVTTVAPSLRGESQWEPGKILLDDYVVEKLLGTGGMADVYLTRSRSTDEQFAVKRILPRLLRDRLRRQLFLHELRNWLDLPEHPHLTACRFFRTVDDQVVIFAEYMEGGSLHNWIRDHRIATLESILDVAIQVAWGLDAAHRSGLVHQDVKPANVLLREDLLGDEWRLAKITDFGLAQAWRKVEKISRAAGAEPTGKSRGAGTPAYCSPEQAAGDAIMPKTDVWGWAVTLVEMLMGKRTWEWGPQVIPMLKRALETKTDAKFFLVDPPRSVVALLQGCFRRNPDERMSIKEAADAALAIYQQETGRRYPRSCPVAPPSQAGPRPRAVSVGGAASWLAKAAKLTGAALAPDAPVAPPKSYRTQVIEELIAYDSAFDVYARLVASGRAELKADLAVLCDEKARVHQNAGDFAGALVLLDRAIGLYDELQDQPGTAERGASSLTEKAYLLAHLNKHAAALDAFERAIQSHQRQIGGKAPASASDGLADCYAGRAATLTQTGNYTAAVDCFDRAIEILEREVRPGGRGELADALADVYRDKAAAMALRGEMVAPGGGLFRSQAGPIELLEEAKSLYDRAGALYGRLGGPQADSQRAIEQARCFVNRANTLSALGDGQDALRSCDFALGYLKPVDGAEHERAVCRMNRAVILAKQEGEQAATEACDEALAMLEGLVLRTGRGELRYELAMGSLNKAISLRALGDDLGAQLLTDRAIKLCERLVQQEGRREVSSDLATCYVNRAVSDGNRGQTSEAMKLFDRALRIWDEIERGGNEVSIGDVALCLMNQGTVSWRKGEPDEALRLYDAALERIHLPMFHRATPALIADVVFCHLNRALVFSHLSKTGAAARALHRVDDLLDSSKILRDGPLLRDPTTAPLVQFVYRRAGLQASPALPEQSAAVDPNRAFQRTRKRLIHLIGRSRLPGGTAEPASKASTLAPAT